MTRAILAALLCALAVAACFVDRPSQAFECATTADCESGRQCTSGYCVVPNCPADCTTCDEAARTCQVECTTADSCGNVTCPSGWDCTINCVGGNACLDIDCLTGSKCSITCTGTDACETVDCSSACKCDLVCASGACNTPDCPSVGNGANQVRCTSDGTATGICDSTRDPGGAKC